MRQNDYIVKEKDLKEAHAKSRANYDMLQNDDVCGCYHCMMLFDPSEIADWVSELGGATAFCPYCGMDTVISKSSGFPLSRRFLEAMYERWFGGCR